MFCTILSTTLEEEHTTCFLTPRFVVELRLQTQPRLCVPASFKLQMLNWKNPLWCEVVAGGLCTIFVWITLGPRGFLEAILQSTVHLFSQLNRCSYPFVIPQSPRLARCWSLPVSNRKHVEISLGPQQGWPSEVAGVFRWSNRPVGWQ